MASIVSSSSVSASSDKGSTNHGSGNKGSNRNASSDSASGSDRRVNLVYVALGSNLGDPRRQVERGLQALTQLPSTRLRARSGWYQSKAVGPGDQPDYINGVVLLETSLDPESLITHLQTIELAQGRERRIRWAARTLDLDILLYGDRVIATEHLQIPHPRLTERNFVLYPLADISPDLILPNGTPLASLLARCPAEGLKRIQS